MATQTLLTVEKFLELPDQEGVIRELDEGRIIEMSAPSFPHAVIVARITHLLMVFTEKTGSEFIVAVGSGFALAADTMRIPDVFLIRKPAARDAPVIRGGALAVAPDLAVEVVSPSDSASDLDRKGHQYLAAGAPLVWVIYPVTKTIMVYRKSGERQEFAVGQQVSDRELLPGLSIPVDRVFADLEG